MIVRGCPRFSEGREALFVGVERLPLEAVKAAELTVRPPNVRLAVFAALGGGLAVPALSVVTASHGPTPLMVAALAAAALMVFAGCYQLVSGAERYVVTLHLRDGAVRVAVTPDGQLAHSFLAELDRLSRQRSGPMLRVISNVSAKSVKEVA